MPILIFDAKFYKNGLQEDNTSKNNTFLDWITNSSVKQ